MPSDQRAADGQNVTRILDADRVRSIAQQLRELGLPESTVHMIEAEADLADEQYTIEFKLTLTFDPTPIHTSWSVKNPPHRSPDDLTQWLEAILTNAKPLGVAVTLERVEWQDVPDEAFRDDIVTAPMTPGSFRPMPDPYASPTICESRP